MRYLKQSRISEETYLDKISSSVVVSALNKIINNIVFGKKLENKKLTKAQSNLEAARYLQFCIDYALEHKIQSHMRRDYII